MPSIVIRTDGIVHTPSNPGLPLPPITIAGHPVDLLQATCCSCMPKSVCIGISDSDGNNSHSVTAMRCNVNFDDGSGDPYALMYSETLPFMGYEIDLQFWLKVINGECLFCLVSDALGVDECQTINAAKRLSREQPYDGFCYELNSDHENIPRLFYGTIWNIVGTIAGDLEIIISAQNTVAITGRRPCLDDLGNITPDAALLKGVCDGCGCLCSKACVLIRITGVNEFVSQQLILSEHLGYPAYVDAYDPDNGTIIRVVGHEYGGSLRTCGLQVYQVGYGYSFSGTSDIVAIQAGENNGCPNFAASWELTDAAGFGVLIDFECTACDDGCQTAVSGCCAGYPIPKVLHCTIRKGPGGASSSCECLPITIPMVNFSGQPYWQGFYKNVSYESSWCNGSYHDFGVQLECGLEWTLRFGNSLYHASPCGGLVYGDDSYGMTCYPISLSFTYESHCCGYTGMDPLGGPSSVIFEITE